ncbi:cyclic GMP-AMP synthase DncV-like nucleotidyltransferase [Micromonospora sp. WMMD1274]|uniref:cyclic GMP-AMP synthase DncV-like nucleotidyltransferase n=1 Tax=Micromonospora sp. WMMD1274 TaxID=3404116 RepID=UPI003B959B87
MEEMLSMLLDGAVETLDISPHLHQLAVDKYEEVGSWLAEHGTPDWRIYPQGSFRLGTVVRPNTPTGEYDIDLVCWLPIAKESTTQAELKERVGRMLHAFLHWKQRQGHGDGPASCKATRRCWTLSYPDDGFHLDVLPTIPDPAVPPTGILLTDKQLRAWQHSNPIGYATWFQLRSQLDRHLVEAKRHANVADVPDWAVRSTLQRLVQVLKWHAMLYFADDPDNRPPSILITTLAARAYAGEHDLFTGTRNVLHGMGNFVENRHGRWWVPNPAHEEENFADKWNEYPERREAFIRWHTDLSIVLDDLVQLQRKGLHVLATRMSESFTPDAVQRSVQRYGERLRQQTTTGALRMGVGGLLTTTTAGPRVRQHTFHGQHTDPRG